MFDIQLLCHKILISFHFPTKAKPSLFLAIYARHNQLSSIVHLHIHIMFGIGYSFILHIFNIALLEMIDPSTRHIAWMLVTARAYFSIPGVRETPLSTIDKFSLFGISTALQTVYGTFEARYFIGFLKKTWEQRTICKIHIENQNSRK